MKRSVNDRGLAGLSLVRESRSALFRPGLSYKASRRQGVSRIRIIETKLISSTLIIFSVLTRARRYVKIVCKVAL